MGKQREGGGGRGRSHGEIILILSTISGVRPATPSSFFLRSPQHPRLDSGRGSAFPLPRCVTKVAGHARNVEIRVKIAR